MCIGSLHGPVQFASDLYRTICSVCRGRMQPHAVCIGSVQDPILCVSELYRVPYCPYRICIGPYTV